jgi:hypothetical protein
MPKLAQTAEQKADEHFRRIVKSKQILSDVKTPVLALAMRRTTKCYYDRMAKPETLTMKEFRAIVRKLSLSAEDVCKIVGI